MFAGVPPQQGACVLDTSCLMQCFQRLLHSRWCTQSANVCISVSASIGNLCAKLFQDDKEKSYLKEIPMYSNESCLEFASRVRDRLGLNVFPGLEVAMDLAYNCGQKLSLIELGPRVVSTLLDMGRIQAPVVHVYSSADTRQFEATINSQDRLEYLRLKKKRKLKANAASAKRTRYNRGSDNLVIYFKAIVQSELLHQLS